MQVISKKISQNIEQLEAMDARFGIPPYILATREEGRRPRIRSGDTIRTIGMVRA